MTAISIVTTSFNQQCFIEEAIESVSTQNYPCMEHIVIDGCSTDGTVEWLQRNADRWETLHWNSGPDSGQSEALNKGFRQAKGDIIGWLNSDDRYRAGAMAAVARAFAENPDVDVIYGDYTLIDDAGNNLTTRREIAFNAFTLLHHRISYVPTTATFFRRRIFDECNWLNEELHYAMDFEFFVRLSAGGYRFKHIPITLADFRLHSASKTCTRASMQLAETRAIARLYSRTSSIRLQRLRDSAFALCQYAAAILRYSEKLMRGYYFTQRNPKFF